jgi:hypothetical protein
LQVVTVTRPAALVPHAPLGDDPPLPYSKKITARRKLRGFLNGLVVTAQTREELDVAFGPDGSLASQAELSKEKRKWLQNSNLVYISHATFDSLCRCAREECRGEWIPRNRKHRNTCVISRRSKSDARQLLAGRQAFIDLSSSEDIVPWPPMEEVKEQVGERRFADERAKFKRLICPDCATRVANKRQRQIPETAWWPSGSLTAMPPLTLATPNQTCH